MNANGAQSFVSAPTHALEEAWKKHTLARSSKPKHARHFSMIYSIVWIHAGKLCIVPVWLRNCLRNSHISELSTRREQCFEVWKLPHHQWLLRWQWLLKQVAMCKLTSLHLSVYTVRFDLRAIQIICQNILNVEPHVRQSRFMPFERRSRFLRNFLKDSWVQYCGTLAGL